MGVAGFHSSLFGLNRPRGWLQRLVLLLAVGLFLANGILGGVHCLAAPHHALYVHVAQSHGHTQHTSPSLAHGLSAPSVSSTSHGLGDGDCPLCLTHGLTLAEGFTSTPSSLLGGLIMGLQYFPQLSDHTLPSSRAPPIA